MFSILAALNFVITMGAAPMIYWGKRLRCMTAVRYRDFVVQRGAWQN